jgi:hypothetical protein
MHTNAETLTMPERTEYPWLVTLDRKHECGPGYSPFVRIEVPDGEESVVIAIPGLLIAPKRRSLRGTMRSGSLITLLAWHDMEDKDPYERGIVMVACLEEGGYVVHVWHELYPWALSYLGVSDKRIEFEWIDQPSEEEVD